MNANLVTQMVCAIQEHPSSWLSTGDLGRCLDLSPQTLRNEIRSGMLKAYSRDEVSSRYKIAKSDAIAFTKNYFLPTR